MGTMGDRPRLPIKRTYVSKAGSASQGNIRGGNEPRCGCWDAVIAVTSDLAATVRGKAARSLLLFLLIYINRSQFIVLAHLSRAFHVAPYRGKKCRYAQINAAAPRKLDITT